MRYYFAPMEGLTDSVYRRLHHEYFGGVDCYYMPFLSPTIHRSLTPKEERELPMAESQPFTAVPQIMTKVAQDFLWAAEQCRQRGYKEVNLNLGCPSGTVVAKGKGSGMLRDLETLERFLDEIFSASVLPVSLKTRLGMEDPQEFCKILELYNRYPVRELIIHPRTRKQFYNGELHIDMFRYAQEHSKLPLCFNGELHSKAECEAWDVAAVMIGRGLVADPGMLTTEGTTLARLKDFHDALLEEYTIVFGSSRNAISRLKENWNYLESRFEPEPKLFKRLRKTTDIGEYRAITAEIFQK